MKSIRLNIRALAFDGNTSLPTTAQINYEPKADAHELVGAGGIPLGKLGLLHMKDLVAHELMSATDHAYVSRVGHSGQAQVTSFIVRSCHVGLGRQVDTSPTRATNPSTGASQVGSFALGPMDELVLTSNKTGEQSVTLALLIGTALEVERLIHRTPPEIEDARSVPPHYETHQLGGTDELDVTGLQGVLADPQNPTSHAPTHASGGSDPIKLDELATPNDNTNLDASATRHGLLRKLSDDATQVLRGDGTWGDADGLDGTAIHDDVSGEIAALTAKASPTGSDFLLIEDAAADNAKKRITIGSLPDIPGIDSDAIHRNVDGEISTITEKATPAGSDLLLIEDSAASNAKKRITISSLLPKPDIDTTAIHSTGSSEISAITLKSSPTGSDLLLIEDAAAGNVKKRITIDSLPDIAGIDSDAIHDNVDGEIAAIPVKSVPTRSDILLIEDYDDDYSKKHITIESLLPNPNIDTSAFHTNSNNEISGLTQKTSPTFNDHLVIEDAAASNAKKRITVGTLYEPVTIFELDWTQLTTQLGIVNGNVTVGTKTWTAVNAGAANGSTTFQILNGFGLQITALAGGDRHFNTGLASPTAPGLYCSLETLAADCDRYDLPLTIWSYFSSWSLGVDLNTVLAGVGCTDSPSGFVALTSGAGFCRESGVSGACIKRSATNTKTPASTSSHKVVVWRSMMDGVADVFSGTWSTTWPARNTLTLVGRDVGGYASTLSTTRILRRSGTALIYAAETQTGSISGAPSFTLARTRIQIG